MAPRTFKSTPFFRVDFSLSITQERGVARGEDGPPEGRRWATAVALALGAGALFCIHLDRPAFFDNEGRYAEVAREMLLRGDFVTPEMDFTLFLNKPPLLYWLTAIAFTIVGMNEWARIATVVAAVLTLLVTWRLGARLLGSDTGLLAGAFLATTLGFVLEARTLRPDAWLIACVAGALACWLAARRATPGRATPWLVAMYATLGFGILAKGLVPLLLASFPIAFTTWRDGRAGVAQLRPILGCAVLAAVVLPWHVLVAVRHPGFAWDYVVNQHLLFFLDKKFPRDSEGDSLLFFWAAFAGRAFPWIVLVPFTAGEAVRGLGRDALPAARATALLWVWLLGVVGFFSLAPSRLEHYTLPALPAVALLAARGFALLRAGVVGRMAWGWLGAVALVLVVAGGVGVTVGQSLLARTYWLGQVPQLIALVLPAGVVVGLGGLLALWAVAGRRPQAFALALAAVIVPMLGIVLRAEAMAEPLFSWKPAAEALVARVPADVETVFESPEEYQLVGGLVFYTQRRITLLEPAGFIPPTYLEMHAGGMFLSRADFETRWRSGTPLALVSDPQRRRDQPTDVVSAPVHVVGRFGDRWILTNYAQAAAR